MPDCRGLAIDFKTTCVVRSDHVEPWEFECPRRGIEFTVPESELVFHSGPRAWLLAKVA